MTRSILTSRRAFLAGTVVMPVVLPCAAMTEPTQENVRADLLALVAELENAPDHQTCSQHWTKAHIAGQLREVLGMAVPPCENRHAYAVFEARTVENLKRWLKHYPKGLGET
jgi:hypothetical protein